jgi:hypothetical protein
MKRNEAERCLTGKLGLERKDRRHITFDLRLDGKLVLPIAVRLSHGSGELTGHELGSLAKDLGLREAEFSSCVGCSVSRDCVYACVITRLLRRIDPLIQSDSDIRNLVKIADLLADNMNTHHSRWNGLETKILDRLTNDLIVLRGDYRIAATVERLLKLTTNRANK